MRLPLFVLSFFVLSFFVPVSVLLLSVPAPPAAAWVDPTTGRPSAARVTRAASIPEKNWQRGHRGVDLDSSPGDVILAAGDGVVAFAGSVAGVPSVSVDHPDGIRTTYQPVHARVAVGDPVGEGQPIGVLGHSTAHDGVHWGALTGPDTYINPLALLATPAIRLKPVDTRIE